MSTSTLIEVFGHILYRFTRGVTEHYNPDEPEFTAEFFMDTVLWKVQDESGTVILLMNLFTKNTATENLQA